MPRAEDPTAKARRVWQQMAPRYERQMKFAEKHLIAGGREWVCSRATGQVLEVAIGTGRNLPLYPAGVTLTGVELSPAMLAQARERAREFGIDADLREGDAQALPFEASSFDTVVCTLSLCAIPDDVRAIAEMARVVRPGGRVLLLDHIGSNWWPVWAVQRFIEVFSVRSEGEYQTRRPALRLPAAGLRIVESERLKLGAIERVHAVKPA
jgi:ubiquinone/menaquinone biosynthesis C-methylase UbiE